MTAPLFSAEIEVPKEQLRAIQRLMVSYPKGARTALMRAINDTLNTGRAEITRRIKGKINVPTGEVRKHIVLRRANRARLAGLIQIDRKRLPLAAFIGPQSRVRAKVRLRGQRPKKLKIRVRREGPAETHPHAFVAYSPRGDRFGVFQRVNAGNGDRPTRRESRVKDGQKYTTELPIRELYGPSVGGVFVGAQGVAGDVVNGLGATFEKNVIRNIDLILTGARPVGVRPTQ